MKQLNLMIKRNIKLFFKEKSLFFVSLITPLILLVLYVAFLGNVYKDGFLAAVQGVQAAEELADGFAGAQLVSSLLSVSCVTVSFCSNMLMVQDKANGTIADLTVAPLKRSKLAFSYYVATTVSSLIVCFCAFIACMIYLAVMGWYLSVLDVLLLCVDIILLASFGTALSSVVNFFLSTNGQISAVGSMVSSTYGFLCGAYMPISQMGVGLQKAMSFLPGTYGTSLFRNHAMNGIIKEMEGLSIPTETIEGLKDAFDCNIYFLDMKVELWVMYAVVIVSLALLIGGYILLNYLRENKNKK